MHLREYHFASNLFPYLLHLYHFFYNPCIIMCYICVFFYEDLYEVTTSYFLWWFVWSWVWNCMKWPLVSICISIYIVDNLAIPICICFSIPIKPQNLILYRKGINWDTKKCKGYLFIVSHVPFPLRDLNLWHSTY